MHRHIQGGFMMKSIYDLPEVYQAVLQKPDEVIEQEVETIHQLLKMHGVRGKKLLNLGCRPNPHGLLLAEKGYIITALDPYTTMLEEASRRAGRRGLNIRTIQANEVDFDLNEHDFDSAIFMFENFPQITLLADIGRNFSSVRRHLITGGIYIVDVDSLTHGIVREGGMRDRQTILLSNGYAERWFEDLPGDWEDGTNCEVLNTRIMLDAELHETHDEWRYRMYTPWDLSLLACGLDGWKYNGASSWRSPGADLRNEVHYFGIYEKIG
jgi:hypothetical protein